MGITYTFADDCPVPELRGVTCHGGVLCRADGKWMNGEEPDAVRFETRVAGKQVMARISGKPELEAALAELKAVIARKESVLAGIKWPAYQAVQRAAYNARAAYDHASDHGYPVREAEAMRRADEALEKARNDYPLAALYAKAEAFSQASHDVKSSAGSKAMAKIENGEYPAQAVADMESAWSAHCANAAPGL